ncbi:LysR family transcriptional regulator [Methylibium petroleiphilum]|uniref:LysR family transcriptional regulator n=1 Tax=Methylibium petroleiphilum TaxID=105560 RepID=UPI001AC16BD0|nr:LysR family transcriptional regulator [Methylibium petroleiphilum]MBN9205321.1 LysR family transcriptional regulator [Methylibium petroleiphilum]
MPQSRPLARPRGVAGFRIDPFDLRLFGAVAEAGSITAGAREMHLSLSAASARLQNLEHALGAALLVRSKQGVVPTDAGRTLRRHAGRLQRDMEALHAEMSAHAHGVRSSVRVLCNTAAMTEYLPALLGRFLVAHPDIDVDLRELGSPDVLRTMRQEHADIGIVADYVDTEGLSTRVFLEDRLVVLQPVQAGGRAGRRALRFADVIDRPFVGLPAESGLSRFLQAQALRQGRGLHHRVRVRSLDAVAALVADGAGIAVVPAVAAARLASARITVRPLADAWATRRLLLCTAVDAEPGAGAAALLRFLSEAS